MLHKRLATLESQEGSAYGAALLAMVGSGEFASVPEASRATIRETESVSPDGETAFYERGHRVYASLYPALQPAFKEIAALS